MRVVALMGMAKPMPSPFSWMAVLMPITCHGGPLAQPEQGTARFHESQLATLLGNQLGSHATTSSFSSLSLAPLPR
jgi:hypothetical protein